MLIGNTLSVEELFETLEWFPVSVKVSLTQVMWLVCTSVLNQQTHR